MNSHYKLFYNLKLDDDEDGNAYHVENVINVLMA